MEGKSEIGDESVGAKCAARWLECQLAFGSGDVRNGAVKIES